MINHRKVFSTAVVLAAATAPVHASDFYWQGTGATGAFNTPNYTKVDNTTSPATVTPNSSFTTGTVAPAPTDVTYIGGGGSVTSSASVTMGLLRLGHASTAAQPTADPGSGTLTNTAGTLQLVGTSAGGTNSGLIVGYNNTGSLSITGGTVNSSFFGKIGYADTTGATGSGSITLSAGTLTIRDNGLQIGEGLAGSLTKTGGTLNVSQANSGDLTVGSTTTGAFSQSGGTTTVARDAIVGRANADGSSFTLSAGTFSTGRLFSVATGTVADDYTDNVSVNLSGGTLTTGTGFVVATGAARGTTMTISNTATLTVTNNFAVADQNSTADNTTLNISGGTATVGMDTYLGRGNTTNTTFNMTGGTLTTRGFFGGNAGTAPAGTRTTSVTAYHSAGSITTTSGDFRLADNRGDTTYNLTGTGSITAAGLFDVGRRNGTGIMNQAGGTVTANGGLHIGDQQNATIDPLLNATGTYTLSGGTLKVSASSTEALSIAPSGTGTFRVVGGDAQMTVTGNMTAYDSTSGTNTGKLVFQPEPNEALTTVNVTGTATFNTGSSLQLDLSLTKPTQGVFTVLDAGNIIAPTSTLALPGGWNYSITAGGLGKQLKLFAGDFNADGRINADDFAIIDRGAAQALAGGANGDLNADGAINSQDYLLIDSAYAQLGAPLSPDFLAARESQFGADYVSALTAAVPEPSSLLACVFATLLPFAKRRRR